MANTIEELTRLVRQVIEQQNAINQNAKKIFELPSIDNMTINENGLLHLSQDGTSYQLKLSTLMSILQSSGQDKIIDIGGVIQLVGNTAIVPTLTWLIDNQIFSNTSTTNLSVPYASVGKIRKDNIYVNNLGEVLLQEGDEYDSNQIAIAPVLPLNSILVTTLDVSDNTINDQNPNIGDNFKKKSESNIIVFNGAGDLPSLSWYNDNSHVILTNATSLSSITTSPAFEPYAGKTFRITNNRAVNITIYENSGTGNIKFSFPNASNYILGPNETIEFFLSQDLTKLNFLGSNMSSASSDEHYVFNSIISATAAASPSYHYRTGAVMNLNLNTASSLTNPADLVGIRGHIIDLIIPFDCRLTHVSMVLPNVDSFSLALVNNSSFNPDLSVRTLKQNFTSTGASIKVIDQNTESLNIDFVKGHGIKLFCMASSSTPASKGGYINLTFKKI